MASHSMRFAGFVMALALGLIVAAPVFAQRDALREAGQLIKLGEYDRALTEVEAYLKEHPKDARGRFLKGLILAEQKKTDAAIAVFTALTQDYPELPEPYNNLAVLYANRGEYNKARSALEMAIRTHPSYATAHENLGDVYAKMASQAYGKALQLDSGNVAAQTKLNLIRELFSSAATAHKPSATAGTSPAVVAKSDAGANAKPAGKPEGKAPAAEKPPAPAPAPRVATGKPTADVKPPAKAAATPAPRDNAQDVLETVEGWARAWSKNDATNYLAHYAPDFDPPQNMSRAAWETQRRQRIAKPRKIEVTVEAPKVDFTGEDRAKVTFRQHYRSDTFNASGIKTLYMEKQGDKWRIKRERYQG